MSLKKYFWSIYNSIHVIEITACKPDSLVSYTWFWLLMFLKVFFFYFNEVFFVCHVRIKKDQEKKEFKLVIFTL
jgi:hypothetical protein